jgi:hypothetical protein
MSLKSGILFSILSLFKQPRRGEDVCRKFSKSYDHKPQRGGHLQQNIVAPLGLAIIFVVISGYKRIRPSGAFFAALGVFTKRTAK